MSAGNGVVIQLTPAQVADAADADPRVHLRKKAVTALEVFNGLSPRTDPVKMRVDLSLHTPDMRLGPGGDAETTFYVLSTQAFPDAHPGADRTIRLHGWITGRAARRYLRETAGSGDHVIPPFALRGMRSMLDAVNPTAVPA